VSGDLDYLFNGIDGETGLPLIPANVNLAELAGRSRSSAQGPERALIEAYRRRHARSQEAVLGLPSEIDCRNLAQAGWGLITPAKLDADAKATFRRALEPLLTLRREQAGVLYRELEVRPRDTKATFLARHGIGDGPVRPDRVPYYLLLVGSPAEIPFEFEFQLAVQYAVGRLHFDDPASYGRYARAVASPRAPTHPRRVGLFGTANRDDAATAMSREFLIEPLHADLAQRLPAKALDRVVDTAASKAALAARLGGAETPSLLFTASHGLAMSSEADPTRALQGALICADWPGLATPVDPSMVFAARDLPPDADLGGLIAMHFACFSAGTPRADSFSPEVHLGFKNPIRGDYEPFLARLPSRMLSNPGGPALAVIGHVDRAWSSSFMFKGPDGSRHTSVAQYTSLLRDILAGVPVGAALDYIRVWHAERASALVQELTTTKYRDPSVAELYELLRLWTNVLDAGSYSLLGDPAVSLTDGSPRGDLPQLSTKPEATLGPDIATRPPTITASHERAELLAILRAPLEVRTAVGDPDGPRLCTRIEFIGDRQTEITNHIPEGPLAEHVMQLHRQTVEAALADRRAQLELLFTSDPV
jgi:hypothetical protein